MQYTFPESDRTLEIDHEGTWHISSGNGKVELHPGDGQAIVHPCNGQVVITSGSGQVILNGQIVST